MENDIFYREVSVEPDEGQSRVFNFVASDETVDSYGDIVRADGWDLRRYKRNPIVLFNHSSMLPVGFSPKVGINGKRLEATIRIAEEGTSELIDTVYKLMKQRILRAVSVGFRATVTPIPIRDKEDRITGFEFNGQELLENSIVSVPANPNALALAKSWGVRESTLQRLAAQDAIVQAAARQRQLTLLRLGASSRR